MAGRPRSRRSCLAVPGSNVRMIEKAQGLPADEVFLDLEDAVAPAAKAAARRNVISALTTGDWGGRTRVVRINDATSPWAYRDVVEVVEAAGGSLDCVMLPKVEDAGHVRWLDLTLGQIEAALGLPVGGIGIEAQIESAAGLARVEEIAAASPRLETLVFGPADFMASLAMPTLAVGALHPDYPGDPFHYVLLRILVAARAHDLQAIDGPYLQIRDLDGFRAAARRTAALGFDGKWVLHPDQIEPANEVFTPSQSEYDRAELILEAYAHHTSEAGGARGAVMLGDEMIDEASRKLALAVVARGRAAGLRRTTGSTPPGATG
ncbi:MAG: CoA ester lyase [Micromonosporaceae bacterium]|jgi:citrate lyase subunit beta/citryl-CoA lyase